MTVTQDVCGWCSIGYEQLAQTCLCVCDHFHSLWCDPWARTPLVAVLLVTRGGVVLQKLRDLRFAPSKKTFFFWAF